MRAMANKKLETGDWGNAPKIKRRDRDKSRLGLRNWRKKGWDRSVSYFCPTFLFLRLVKYFFLLVFYQEKSIRNKPNKLEIFLLGML